MSDFTSLINEVADTDRPLSQTLLKAKVLASKLRSRTFKQWVDNELNGYELNKPTPRYREVQADLYGDYHGFVNSKNLRIDAKCLPPEFDDFKEVLKHYKMLNSIASLESLLASDHHFFGNAMDGYMVNLLRMCGPQIDGSILNFVNLYTTRQSLVTMVSSARSYLLDFLLTLQQDYPELASSDTVPPQLDEANLESKAQQNFYKDCIVQGDQAMGDIYQAGQVGAMGPKAKAENINFFQILREAIGTSSLNDLAQELEKLRATLLPLSQNEEQDKAVAAVAAAEEAAKEGDAKGVMSFLKATGKWGFDMASKIGAALAAKAIEKSMGM
ncbi:MAG: hypothetical protein QM703_08435 [Gemmatales bacterium]